METIYIQHPISKSITAKMESCVLALGFFDGVHIGHQGILNEARKIAKREQLSFGVMTFYPHPRDIVSPNSSPMKYLTPLPIKEERFEQMGVEKLFIVKFEPKFAALTPEDFVQQYIVGLSCKHVVAGFDYHYGRKGQGNMATLAAEGSGRFQVTTVEKINYGNEKISSTAIRELLSTGNVGHVPKHLGGFYEVSGRVLSPSLHSYGDPFLKIVLDEGYTTPAAGVYKIAVEVNGTHFPGICYQISVKDRQSFLFVKIADCNLNCSQKRVKVIWHEQVLESNRESRIAEEMVI